MNTYTVEELYRLAQQGNTEALTRLGICYKNGTGTAVDHSAAAQYFTQQRMQEMQKHSISLVSAMRKALD